MRELTVVIPVYNSAAVLADVIAEVFRELDAELLEVILVNDGSMDDTDRVIRGLVAKYAPRLKYLELARNYSEHNAVLAGLHEARGDYVAILDDDGQNPPAEVLKMLEEIKKGYDVVYGVYRTKRHESWRNWGSWLNGVLATFFLRKPRGLYLSSFKIMTRNLVEGVKSFVTPYPYLDGLILQLTGQVGQVTVEHRTSELGCSRYRFRRLVRLCVNMILSFSILPLRAAIFVGVMLSVFGFGLGVWVIWEKFQRPDLPVGYASLIVSVLIVGGILALLLGVIGEYVGRVFLVVHRKPAFWVRTRLGGHGTAHDV